MYENYDSIDSFVNEVKGNIRYLDNLVAKTHVLKIVGTVGLIGFVLGVLLFVI